MAYITKKTTVNGVKPIGSNLFGTCSTGASTTQKTVTMADFDVTYYNGSWYQNDMQSGGGSTYTEIPNAYGTTAEIT